VKLASRLVILACSAALVAGALALPASAVSAARACGGSGSVRTVTGRLHDGATFKLQCPAGRWNGTLFLYSHGYVVPGSANPAEDVGDPVTGGWLLGHGYALAGSSYATTGWAIQQALPDQIATLDAFGRMLGRPSRTIAWGHSLGGIITAGLIQRYPRRFKAALPMCGVLAGGVAVWNGALDSAFAFQQLLDPSVQVVHIKNPLTNLNNAEAAAAKAQKTAKGRARLALATALNDEPGWFTPLSPEPRPTAYAEQEANQYQWLAQIDGPFIFAFRADLEARADGNPSWNTGVNYSADLAKSANLAEVKALYQTAGLSLGKDLTTLNRAPRISADQFAVAYLAQNIAYNGEISVPTLTVHTIGDGLVVPENEQAYRSVVDRDGRGNLLQQLFVDRAGHCAFTPAEIVTSMQVLLNRLSTGHWNVPAPATLNADAAALGPDFNIYDAGAGIVATPPAFASFSPTRYLRPFDLFPFPIL
jgi:pimeloyl-ACP methyl ester carboxylesterase